MDTKVVPVRGWGGSAEIWLDAAYLLLVEGGVEAVKVMPMAERLGLSRTSFYWHFADRDALLAGLIARWQSHNTANLVAKTNLPAATITEATLNLFDCWIMPDLFDSRMEFAIRTWALTDADLGKTLAEVDATRIAAIKTMFRRFGFADAEADIRAHTIYLTQIGYISMRMSEPLLPRLERIPAYALTFTGLAPLPAEVAAFRARHIQASRISNAIS
jgi:AcrR family transcriptional regulator